jgi:hypothetical protein
MSPFKPLGLFLHQKAKLFRKLNFFGTLNRVFRIKTIPLVLSKFCSGTTLFNILLNLAKKIAGSPLLAGLTQQVGLFV